MKNNRTYQLLVSKMLEVSSLPPQEVGRFTPVYKRFVPYLKFSPWKSVLCVSFAIATLLYLVFGIKVIHLASILQFGF